MYKVRKVKEDKKLVRNLLAMDLPAKPRYPVFRAVAGLCLTMAIVETEERAETESLAEATAAPTTRSIGQGAYMDGQSSFVDLEANRPEDRRDSDSSSTKRHRKKRERKEKRNRKVEQEEPAAGPANQQTATLVVGIITGEEPAEVMETEPIQGGVSDVSDVSELSDASEISNESSSESSSDRTYDVDAVKSADSEYSASGEYSRATAQSSVEPSDFSEIAYTLSSDSDVLLDNDGSSDKVSEPGSEGSDRVASELRVVHNRKGEL